MIRWCAYCQRYQGEVEPFDDYSMTHGICEACSHSDAFLHEAPANLAPIQRFFARVADSATAPGETASELVREGTALGLDPIDLLLGIVQPVLRLIGDRWARAEATISEEHRISALCSSVIQLLMETDVDLAALRHAREPCVLLVGAEGNDHTLGLQLLDVVLLRHHISAFTVYPGLPLDEVARLAHALRPRIVAVSAALEEQLKSAVRLEERLRSLPKDERPLVVVGGLALRNRSSLPKSDSVIFCQDLSTFIELASSACAAQPQPGRGPEASAAR